MKTLTLPKPYLSWSQYNLWNTNPSAYRKIYFEKEQSFVTKEMKFGKNFSEALEEENFFGASERAKKIYCGLPKCNQAELELRANVDGINLLSYLDTAEVEGDLIPEFREYKTGKAKWTQARANEHGQIKFYAVVITEKTGKPPKKANLDWIPTIENGNGIEFTGEIKSFPVRITKKDVNAMKGEIKRTAVEISEAFERWKQQKKEDINQKLLKDFWKTQQKLDELKAKEAELKGLIQANFEECLVDNYQTAFGSFYFTNRKKFHYSEYVKIEEAKLKELKKAEEQTAEYDESKIFSFRKK